MEQQPPQAPYEAPRQTVYAQREAPLAPVMTVGQWLVTYLLLAIPLVNIVLIFVWALSDGENPNRRNWAIAILIMWAIALVIVAFAWGAIIAAMGGFIKAVG